MASDSKQALRRHYRQERRRAGDAAADGIARAAATALPALLARGRHLGLYWPIGDEPDLLALSDTLPTDQRLLALPAVQDGQLHYRPWRPGDTLTPDACGIAAPTQPRVLAAAELGLLLVPALALDRRGIRLGYGGGWFDRLRSDPAWRRVPALAVLPQACLVEQLPADPWDVPFDGWLDERGLHWLQAV
jgi:5-formyltetrahydrofolate cyclo-ligase